MPACSGRRDIMLAVFEVSEAVLADGGCASRRGWHKTSSDVPQAWGLLPIGKGQYDPPEGAAARWIPQAAKRCAISCCSTALVSSRQPTMPTLRRPSNDRTAAQCDNGDEVLV